MGILYLTKAIISYVNITWLIRFMSESRAQAPTNNNKTTHKTSLVAIFAMQIEQHQYVHVYILVCFLTIVHVVIR